MRIFDITPRIRIVCNSENARNGFRHRATLFVGGREVDETTAHYINRTWESYEFRSVMQKLIDKTNALNPTEKQLVKNWLRGDRTDWSGFQMTGMVAKLGDVFGQTPKEKNDWKARMIKAGLGSKGLEMPEDWNTLSEETKEARLNKVIGFISAKGKVRSKMRKKKPMSQTNSIIKQFVG